MAEGALSAHRYLDHVLDLLSEGSELGQDEHIVFHAGDRTGLAWATFAYPGGYLLHVRLMVDCTWGAPLWRAYSFHLVGTDGRLVMRCDNSTHYPDLPSFPHHRHVGPAEEVEPAEMPTLRRVVAEVARVVQDGGARGP